MYWGGGSNVLARLMKHTGEVGGLFVLLDETWVIYITRSSQAAAATSDHIAAWMEHST